MTGDESKFIRRVEQQLTLSGLSTQDSRLWWPRRSMFIRRRGKRRKTLTPIFPGYLFLETRVFTPDLYRLLRHTDSFVRFLPENLDISPLDEEGTRLIRHFVSHGEIVRESRVFFDKNNRIVVKEGPLKGLEGSIIKVDRRKGRAKVRLDLYQESFQIDLAFETMEPATPAAEPSP